MLAAMLNEQSAASIGGSGSTSPMPTPVFQQVGLDVLDRSVAATDRGVTVTAGSTRHECDYAVLAVPPLTWNRIAFSPRLHVTTLPQMGSNVKFLMKTKDHFWTRGKLAPDQAPRT